jgi:3-methyl-2-oxobutanoate hydroxymethyltransferase
MARISVHELKAMKQRGEKFAMLTAYDYPTAKLAEAAGVPALLVGDSLGMVVLGYESTVPVTMEDILHHTRAVVRGSTRAVVVADLPFMSYQADPRDAVRNAGRLLQEGGATAVKLEGGTNIAETAARIVEAGIPCMGHLGLTPQSVNQIGGYKVQGKTPAAAVRIMSDAQALEQAGCFAIVLESIQAPLGRLISERLSIPTIGIGAGPYCDGQVQVVHDMLGLFPDFRPKHAGRYANLGEQAKEAIARYVVDVREGNFPTRENSFGMDDNTLAELFALGIPRR